MTDPVLPTGSLAPIAAPRGRLFRKYLVSFVAIVSVALIAKGTIDGWFSFQEQKRLLIGIQHEQADSAAAKIGLGTEFMREAEGVENVLQARAGDRLEQVIEQICALDPGRELRGADFHVIGEREVEPAQLGRAKVLAAPVSDEGDL